MLLFQPRKQLYIRLKHFKVGDDDEIQTIFTCSCSPQFCSMIAALDKSISKVPGKTHLDDNYVCEHKARMSENLHAI